MQEQILKIELILENCEVITIDGRYIGDFNINNIKTNIRRTACNYIGRDKICEGFILSVYRDANIEESTQWTLGETSDKRRVFDRVLEYKDITSIEVYFSDGKKEFILVPWNGHDYNNTYQKSYINKNGDLFLVIGKEMRVDEIWDESDLEDDFIWTMYGCK